MKPKEIQKRLKSDRMNSLREDMKAQGFFDGRFRPKQVKDKRKEESRTLARKRIIVYDI